VWVRDLFFNQPARRKFLKSEKTEFGHVVDTLTRLALGRPEIHFSLRQKNRQIHDWPAAINLQQRLAQIFPKRSTQSWLAVSHRQGVLSLVGFLSPPELYRSNSRMLFLYVNGRPVWDRQLRIALLEAYRTLLPKGKYPLGVLLLELPAEQVDVNVHPTKAEVRFQDPRTLCKTVTNAAQAALATMERQRWTRPLAAGSGLRPARAPIQSELAPLLPEGVAVSEPRIPTYDALDFPQRGLPTDTESRQPPEKLHQELGALFVELNVIGQFHNTYILCEAPDGLILIDQHAAHELFTKRQLKGNWQVRF
jgi:DNA mismatch repair protein MutL